MHWSKSLLLSLALIAPLGTSGRFLPRQDLVACNNDYPDACNSTAISDLSRRFELPEAPAPVPHAPVPEPHPVEGPSAPGGGGSGAPPGEALPGSSPGSGSGGNGAPGEALPHTVAPPTAHPSPAPAATAHPNPAPAPAPAATAHPNPAPAPAPAPASPAHPDPAPAPAPPAHPPAQPDQYADRGRPTYERRGNDVLSAMKTRPADHDQNNIGDVSKSYDAHYKNDAEGLWDISKGLGFNHFNKLEASGFKIQAKLGFTLARTSTKGAPAGQEAFSNAYGFKQGATRDQFVMACVSQSGAKDTNKGTDRVRWSDGRAAEMKQYLDEAVKKPMSKGVATNKGGIVTRFHIENKGTIALIDEAVQKKTGKAPGKSSMNDPPITLTPADDTFTPLAGSDNGQGSIYMFADYKETFGNLEMYKIDVWPGASDGKSSQYYGMNLWFRPMQTAGH